MAKTTHTTGPVTRAIRAMNTEPPARRGFLRGLLSLPLIGGGVTLIGAPTAVAEPITLHLMKRYVAFLAREHGRAHGELLRMIPEEPCHWATAPRHPVADLHVFNWPEDARAGEVVGSASPSTRAALVLSAAGIDWR